MSNPIQLLRDFLKWRQEKYREKLIDLSYEINKPSTWEDNELALRHGKDTESDIWRKGVLYGIIHRKKILKKLKL